MAGPAARRSVRRRSSGCGGRRRRSRTAASGERSTGGCTSFSGASARARGSGRARNSRGGARAARFLLLVSQPRGRAADADDDAAAAAEEAQYEGGGRRGDGGGDGVARRPVADGRTAYPYSPYWRAPRGDPGHAPRSPARRERAEPRTPLRRRARAVAAVRGAAADAAGLDAPGTPADHGGGGAADDADAGAPAARGGAAAALVARRAALTALFIRYLLARDARALGPLRSARSFLGARGRVAAHPRRSRGSPLSSPRRQWLACSP